LFSKPQCDGGRVLFTITAEGRRTPRAISRSALQSLSGHTYLATSDLLDRFMDSRDKIEEIASRIFHITPEWVSGPVSISADDIDNLPPARAFSPHELVPFTMMVRRPRQVREYSRQDLIR
jgi:Protein of unknown function (DUF1488)